ncbi:hypothetical protein [uncultured Mediterranean phage uvMED]|nr:hypothetical protein [uncultured Mediterranean phage uvMED]
MMNQDLDVLYSTDGTSFTDYSFEAMDFLRKNFTLTFGSTSILYIGYHKPISRVTFQLSTNAATNTSMSLKYYNGSSFVALKHYDYTDGLTASGDIIWERLNYFTDSTLDEATDIKETTINSKKQYWYKLELTDSSEGARVFKGINLLYSDNEEVKKIDPFALDLVDSSVDTLPIHVRARDVVLEELKKLGYFKYDDNFRIKQLTKWDLLKIDQVKIAASEYVVSQLYQAVSDQPNDNYAHKAEFFFDRFLTTLKLIPPIIDEDDDGRMDEQEKQEKPFAVRLGR